MASRPYLPVSTSLFAGGPGEFPPCLNLVCGPLVVTTDTVPMYVCAVHPEFTGYKAGELINQADVALLQYPLDFAMPQQLKRNDLTYYSSVTRTNGRAVAPSLCYNMCMIGACSYAPGYFTGDSSYSIAWLAMGNRTLADPWLQQAFLHMDLTHFNVWKERAITGTSARARVCVCVCVLVTTVVAAFSSSHIRLGVLQAATSISSRALAAICRTSCTATAR